MDHRIGFLFIGAALVEGQSHYAGGMAKSQHKQKILTSRPRALEILSEKIPAASLTRWKCRTLGQYLNLCANFFLISAKNIL
jgi:hypothetical protein